MSPLSVSSSSLDSIQFRKALGCFATGVAIVSIRTDNDVLGITINSLASVSLAPPLLLWCLGREADRYDDFATAEQFGLNILAADQEQLSRHCAEPGQASLAHEALHIATSGTPLLANAAATLDCMTRQRIAAGDHLIILAEAQTAEFRKTAPLVYHQGDYTGLTPNK